MFSFLKSMLKLYKHYKTNDGKIWNHMCFYHIVGTQNHICTFPHVLFSTWGKHTVETRLYSFVTAEGNIHQNLPSPFSLPTLTLPLHPRHTGHIYVCIILFSQWTTKTLITLCGCADWSASLLFALVQVCFLMTRLKCTIYSGAESSVPKINVLKGLFFPTVGKTLTQR